MGTLSLGGSVHYSGLLVRAVPQHLERCAARIDACDGADVYITYPDSSSLVVVLESETVAEQQATFRMIRDLPDVLTTDLVFHRVDDARHVGDIDGQPEGVMR